MAKDIIKERNQSFARALSRDGERLEKVMFETLVCDELIEVWDGCRVECDGQCPHGYVSPLKTLGLV